MLPSVEIETKPDPDCAVIWLHGLGVDGNDFVPIVDELGLDDELKIRFIFPHAPSIPVTVNCGYVMPAWFDIYAIDINRKIDTDGLLLSADAINLLIERELERGIASGKIVLAGFSQGGAVAYQSGLTYPAPLGGILAMSSYFATSDTISLHPANREIPISIQHGVSDTVVSEQLGQKSFEFLKQHEYRVEYRTYEMDHEVCPSQIADIGNWLRQVLF